MICVTHDLFPIVTILLEYSGIFLYSSSNNTIYNNYFSNTNNAFDDGKNIWNIPKALGINIINGTFSGGNFWSDYRGTDSDGDGIGDTPYYISGGSSVDRSPLMRHFSGIILFPCEGCKTPTDPDNDSLYEDINGNGRKDFNDVVLFFKNLEWIPVNETVAYFDFNGNGRIDFADVVKLFEEL